MTAFLDRLVRGLPTWALLPIAAVLAGLLGLVDHWTGSEISFSIAYLAPVALVAWYGRASSAWAICLLTALTWLVADLTTGHVYSHRAIPLWNATVRLGFFVIVARLLLALRRSLRAERAMADTDPLTGLANRRRFYELLGEEMERSRRYGHPFTVAYVDLDDFKAVNDRWGHETGDRVLEEVAAHLRGGLRATDRAARLGGDEFALLLPETDGEGAGRVLPSVRERLRGAMADGAWPVGFSVGAATFQRPRGGPDDVVRVADALMYEVKRSEKGAIRYLAAGEAEGV